MIRTVQLGLESQSRALPLTFDLNDGEPFQFGQDFRRRPVQNISLSAELDIRKNDTILLNATSDEEVEIEIYCFSRTPPPPGFKPCPEAGVIKSSIERTFTRLRYNEPEYYLSRSTVNLRESFTTKLYTRRNDTAGDFMAVTFFENRNAVFLIIRLFAEF